MGKAWPALDIHVPSCDPQLQELVLAELDDFQPTAIQEQDDPPRLRAFFRGLESRDAAARALGASFGSHLFVQPLDVEDDDWAARSQAQLRAITVGRLVIAPPWDTYKKRGQTPLLVLIQPSMGFGTGHHATTRLILRALQELPLEGLTVLDIGCGSGVLAIAAARLGARVAVGMDIDPDALTNAAENLELNDLEGRVRFEEGDFRERALRADLVMANLTGSLLERSASHLADLVESGGYLIVSGFMDSEKAPVLAALQARLRLHIVAHEGEWICAVFGKTHAPHATHESHATSTCSQIPPHVPQHR